MRRATVLVVLGTASAIAGCAPISQTHHRPGTDHGVATGGAGVPVGEQHATVTITDGRVTPPSGWVEVARGRQVSLTVTSDTPDELRVPGYPVTAQLPARTPVTVRFTADTTGVFEVRTREGRLVLLQVAVK